MTKQHQHVNTRMNHTHKSLGDEKIMETGGFQEPLTCPTGLCQAPQVPKDPNDTGEQPWVAALALRPGNLVLTYCLPMASLVVTSGCMDWCVPTPNRSLMKGAPAQCRPDSHQN